jgi:hypothetical protein
VIGTLCASRLRSLLQDHLLLFLLRGRSRMKQIHKIEPERARRSG